MAAFKFLSLLRLEYKAVLLGLMCAFLASFSSAALMATAGWFLTAMAVAGATGSILNLFIPSSLIRLLAITRTVLRYADRLLSHQAAFRLVERLRARLFDQALQIDLQRQFELRHADVQFRLQHDVENLELMYVRMCVPAVVAVLCGLVAGCVLYSLDVLLCAGFVILYLTAGLLLPVLCALPGQRRSRHSAQLSLQLNAQAAALTGGLYDFSLLRCTQFFTRPMQRISTAIARAKQAAVISDGLCQAGILLCSLLCFVFMLYAGCNLMVAGKLTSPEVMLAAIGSLSVFENVVPLCQAVLSVPEVNGSARRVFSVLEAGSVRTGHRAAREKTSEKIKLTAPLTRMELRHLSFAYNADRTVFADLTVSFDADCNYALQGPSGCGKSTVLYLLSGLLPAPAGCVFYNGTEASALDIASVRTQIACCLQDPMLLRGTVREMFRMVKSDLSEQQMWDCLETVELAPLVRSLPRGADSVPAGLSGGQARRMALARALCLDTPFLLLDEPGEGLDVLQEERILARIMQRRRGVIMVTHRQGGVKFCQHVIRLQRPVLK